MITLGTIFILIMAWANWKRWRGRLQSSTALLWVLMLAFPFPYIANSLGWMTAELGRQPWLVYGLFRTAKGYSQVVSAGPDRKLEMPANWLRKPYWTKAIGAARQRYSFAAALRQLQDSGFLKAEIPRPASYGLTDNDVIKHVDL
jgi:hypothetical protein